MTIGGYCAGQARSRPSLAGRACRGACRLAAHAAVGVLGRLWIHGLDLSVQALVRLSPRGVERYSERYMVSPLRPELVADNDLGRPPARRPAARLWAAPGPGPAIPNGRPECGPAA